MRLVAVFESWYIPDGNYPLLAQGQVVRLSFQLRIANVRPAEANASPTLESLGDGEYRVVAKVLGRYGEQPDSLIALEAGGFRFYITGEKPEAVRGGSVLMLEGTLLVDPFFWVESWHRYTEPPNLFYTLRITRLRKVEILERFISRGATVTTLPTSVRPADFGSVRNIETMVRAPSGAGFFLLDLDDQGLSQQAGPLTFIGGRSA